MAKTEAILMDHGITEKHLVKLYRYDLLDILSNIHGIGCGRIAELQQDLEQTHSQSRLPKIYTWIYKLAIDTLKIPTGDSFYQSSNGDKVVLSDLRDIDGAISSAVNDWLSTTLPKREFTVLLRLYRDGKTPHEVARILGISYQSLTKLKTDIICKLRSPANQKILRDLICFDDNAIPS